MVDIPCNSEAGKIQVPALSWDVPKLQRSQETLQSFTGLAARLPHRSRPPATGARCTRVPLAIVAVNAGSWTCRGACPHGARKTKDRGRNSMTITLERENDQQGIGQPSESEQRAICLPEVASNASPFRLEPVCKHVGGDAHE